MKRIVWFLLSFFLIGIFAMTAGCGKSELEGKWILEDPHESRGFFSLTIQKEKDNVYRTSLYIEEYALSSQIDTFSWRTHLLHEETMDFHEKKNRLISRRDPSFALTYQDGKLYAASTGQQPDTFVKCTDAVYKKAKEDCKNTIIKSFGSNVKFASSDSKGS